MKNHYKKALNHLRKDPVMKKLLSEPSLEFPQWRETSNLFEALIRTIANQQLSGKAAATILSRFKNLFEGNSFPKPSEILKKKDDELRRAGFSYPKIKYIKGIAESVENKTIDLKNLKNLSDEEIIEKLTKLKGIGRWSAEMILIFSLKRPDVFSLGDLGLTTAVSKLYKVDKKNLKKIEKISLKWSPYRSIAAWYLWRSLDNTPKISKVKF